MIYIVATIAAVILCALLGTKIRHFSRLHLNYPQIDVNDDAVHVVIRGQTLTKATLTVNGCYQLSDLEFRNGSSALDLRRIISNSGKCLSKKTDVSDIRLVGEQDGRWIDTTIKFDWISGRNMRSQVISTHQHPPQS